ncbi:ABC transporter permease [Acidisoma sp. C75]
MRRILRPGITALGLILVWWAITAFTPIPPYMLPSPPKVALALIGQWQTLCAATLTTFLEILFGLAIGILMGAGLALAMVFSGGLRRWLLPVLVLSQAIPVFALAPLLVLWFGFGMASKVVMAVLVIFFPITASFFDGLRRVDAGWLDLARGMGASRWAMLRHVRLPAALPAFASGLRVAAAIAPIGAIIGEWVGSSAGLGYVMMNANARIQTDVMFAALFILAVMTVLLWTVVDWGMRRLLYWLPETAPPS